ncbi:MAG: heterodisulfide reductase-related iron-sulfur binding cluster [Anaerolineales bacterium]
MTTQTSAPDISKDRSTSPWNIDQLIQHWIPRIRRLFDNAILQKRVYGKIYPGIMHALLFWGVTIQIIGTVINLMQMALFVPFVELPFPRGMAYLIYELLMDTAGIAILIGVTMAAFRRFVIRPKSLPSRWDDIYALILLALVAILGFTLEASRIISANPLWANWSPAGNAYAKLLSGIGYNPLSAIQLHTSLFWIHAALGLLFLASIPFTKLRHLISTPLNILTYPDRKTGELDTIENIEEVEKLGVGRIDEFNSFQLVSIDACLQCGRCEEVCPATISGASYSPRSLIQSLRDVLHSDLIASNGEKIQNIIGETFPEEFAWACTTCGACIEKCPAFINPVDEVIDLRRYQSLTTGKLPKSIGDTLRNFERHGNPWGFPLEQRSTWKHGLEIRELSEGEETDVLLFLGCAFALDERNIRVTKSFINLLKESQIDFAILGLDEVCCGETARRMGNEYLFQVFAEQNIEVLSSVKFNRIVTQCPHCFNTIKNEYPKLGGAFQIQHYTEFLVEIQGFNKNLKYEGNGENQTITYHDSCYLGRINQIIEQPRKLLRNLNIDIVEMERNRKDSFCCGGGGGQMWMETDVEARINYERLHEALETKAELIATACPYCLLMFDDAIRSKGITNEVKVMDISEILERNLIE